MQSSHALRQASTTASNPIDLIEEIIAGKEWVYDRRCDTELAVAKLSCICPPIRSVRAAPAPL